MSNAIVLDVETTGFSPTDDRIIEIAIVDFVTGQPLLHTLIHPERTIPPKITELTRIRDEDLVGKPVFRDHAPVIAAIIADAEAVIGQNPAFDKGMIDGEINRLGDLLSPINWPTLICTKRTWDIHEPREERHLQNAYKRFVDRRGFENAHGAMQDTIATREVLKAQIDHFGLHDVTWANWDPEQKLWWGPTSHVIWVDDSLVFNIGKNKGKPVEDVDFGFWKWLSGKDFPEHVKELARVCVDEVGPARASRIYQWARTFFLQNRPF